MKVIDTYVVRHENGLTRLYKLENETWLLIIPVFLSAGLWMDTPCFIDEYKAIEYIKTTLEELKLM